MSRPDGGPMSSAGSLSAWLRNPAEVAQFTLNCIEDAVLTTDSDGSWDFGPRLVD